MITYGGNFFMDNYSGNKEYNIYRDIRNRTNGEIYLGIVGPAHWKIHLHQTVYGVDGTSFYGRRSRKRESHG